MGREVVFALIDESANSQIYRVTALLVRGVIVADMVGALDQVVERAHTKYGLPRDAELHGHEILQAKGQWDCMRGLHRARIGIYRESVEIVARHASAVIIRGVDRKRFELRYSGQPDWSADENALIYTLEEVDRYAEQHDLEVWAFADESRLARRATALFSFFKQHSTWGYKGRRITNITNLDFTSSASNREIQAADLVSYIHHRYTTHQQAPPKSQKATEDIWRIIEPKVIVNRDWVP